MISVIIFLIISLLISFSTTFKIFFFLILLRCFSSLNKTSSGKKKNFFLQSLLT